MTGVTGRLWIGEVSPRLAEAAYPAKAVVGEPGPCTDCVRPRLVMDETERQVEAQAVTAVSVV